MLAEKYRPKTWSDLVGQDKAVATVRRIIERPGFDRGAFWIEASGANNSGIGKSSLAWLIANQLADDFFITELDGSRCDKSAVIDMERSAALCAWSESKRFKAWIINEAHAITSGAVDVFLTFLERLPRHCVVIFTTTRRVDEGLFGDHDSGPFSSRCHQVTLTNQGISKALAERALWIAQQEGLDSKPLAEYVKAIQARKNNMRALIMFIESGGMLGA